MVWTNKAGVPQWLNSLPTDLAAEFLKIYVMSIVGGFKDKIILKEAFPLWKGKRGDFLRK